MQQQGLTAQEPQEEPCSHGICVLVRVHMQEHIYSNMHKSLIIHTHTHAHLMYTYPRTCTCTWDTHLHRHTHL